MDVGRWALVGGLLVGEGFDGVRDEVVIDVVNMVGSTRVSQMQPENLFLLIYFLPGFIAMFTLMRVYFMHIFIRFFF